MVRRGFDYYNIGWPGPPTCGNEIDQNPPPIFYPVFAAYTGTAVNSLTSANCLPVSLDSFPYAVEFDAVKGQTYQIAFDGNMGTIGDIPLYLALTKPASNDNFENRIKLHGIYVAATATMPGATRLLQAWAWIRFSFGYPRQHVEPLFEAVGLERFLPFAVVEWVVCVNPVALPVNREVRDLREFRGLNQKLLLGDQ